MLIQLNAQKPSRGRSRAPCFASPKNYGRSRRGNPRRSGWSRTIS